MDEAISNLLHAEKALAKVTAETEALRKEMLAIRVIQVPADKTKNRLFNQAGPGSR